MFDEVCSNKFFFSFLSLECPYRRFLYHSYERMSHREKIEGIIRTISSINRRKRKNNYSIRFAQITRLDLSGNAVTRIPGDEISRLVELEILNLARNRITSFPDGVSPLKSLRELDLSGNVIKGTAEIRSLGQLPSLKVLYLSRNPLSELDGLISGSLEALDAGQCGIYIFFRTWFS